MSFGKRDSEAFREDARNRRQASRRRVLKAVKLIFNDGRSVLDASLRDMSETGARLTLSDRMMRLPELVILRLNDGRDVAAQVVRQNDRDIGLHFTDKIKVEQGKTGARANELLGMMESVAPYKLLRTMELYQHMGNPKITQHARSLGESFEALRNELRRIRDAEAAILAASRPDTDPE
ncbi:PilZ domain-containing protein [Roseospirillum parvum]|uniref:PilZ domain-containing protein n=1 Tax=Roseospirillum parvum TaxID=83401 RepID=A0A1G7U4M5_9PROT|nr:PilZ domain-containing protein [Roseospirillum parvum]SDG42387.1 PilZ domain-containing protein [Roseospirillum parvum]